MCMQDTCKDMEALALEVARSKNTLQLMRKVSRARSLKLINKL